MIAVARLVAWVALATTILPAVLFLNDRMTLDRTQLWMLVATIAWFASAPIWMERRAEK
jgi:hypothetical protein